MTQSVEQQKELDLAIIVGSDGIEGLSEEQFKERYGVTVAEAKAPAKKKAAPKKAAESKKVENKAVKPKDTEDK